MTNGRDMRGGGISYIIQTNKIPVYDAPDMAELDVSKGYFRILGRDDLKGREIGFQYEQGKLYICDKENKISETLFCHFQKRQIEFGKNIDADNFYFVAPGHVTSRPMEIGRRRIKECIFQVRYYKNKIQKKLCAALHKEDSSEVKLKVIQRGKRPCQKRN